MTLIQQILASARVVVENAIESVEISHPCDTRDRELRIRMLPEDVRALHAALAVYDATQNPRSINVSDDEPVIRLNTPGNSLAWVKWYRARTGHSYSDSLTEYYGRLGAQTGDDQCS